MDEVRLARVVVWPVADPKRDVHLAMPEWQVHGLALCGLPVRDVPTPEYDMANDCAKCMARARELETNTAPGVVKIEGRLTPTGYGADAQAMDRLTTDATEAERGRP